MAHIWLELLGDLAKMLNPQQIEKLERLRENYSIPHDFFVIGVSASSEIGNKIIRRDYNDLSKRNKYLSEKEKFVFLLNHENKHIKLSGSNHIMTDDQIENAVLNMNNLDDLCEFITNLEKLENPLIYENEIFMETERIIKEN